MATGALDGADPELQVLESVDDAGEAEGGRQLPADPGHPLQPARLQQLGRGPKTPELGPISPFLQVRPE